MAFLSLFFLGINFVFIMYGRNPFLEISAIFLLVSGFYFMALSFNRSPFLIFSGICFAGGIFFGQTMAAFILPACLGVLLLWMLERSRSAPPGINFKPFLLFTSGFVLVSVFWLFFSYLPAKREVAGYLGEQALGLYGFPKALQSLSGFVTALFTFGTDLFYRMPVVFLLSFLGLLLFFRNNSSIKELVEHRDHRSQALFFLTFWFLGGFFLLMILNYRPLRYQLYLIPPMCALGGWWLDRFLRPSDSRGASFGILFWIFFAFGTTFFINYIITTLYRLSRKPAQLSSSLSISFIFTLLLGGLFYWRTTRSKRSPGGEGSSPLRWLNPGKRFSIMLLLVLLSLLVNGWQYLSWASSPTYSLSRSSLDLGRILSQDAVVSGPYGPALVWDNQLKNVIHMFGVTRPDPRLFRTYPITHLALERGGNRDRAFRDYPQVMKNAKIVTTYWLRNIPVDIYRIGEWTNNPQAEKYQLSEFEKAKMLLDEGETDSAMVLLEEFISENPENISGYQTLAKLYYDMEMFQEAAMCLKQATQFHPTDFLIHQQLGSVYLTLMKKTGEDRYRLLAIQEWEKALKLFPQNTNLATQLQMIRGY